MASGPKVLVTAMSLTSDGSRPASTQDHRALHLVGVVQPQRQQDLERDQVAEIDRILQRGAIQAREITVPILEKTYDIIGMVR